MSQDDAQWRQQVDARLVGPAATPPPGVTSNFTNGPSRHKYNIVCQTICLTTVTTLVVIRVYTKSRVLKSLGWDDGKLIVSSDVRNQELIIVIATSVLAWVKIIPLPCHGDISACTDRSIAWAHRFRGPHRHIG